MVHGLKIMVMESLDLPHFGTREDVAVAKLAKSSWALLLDMLQERIEKASDLRSGRKLVNDFSVIENKNSLPRACPE
jgi:hypothetical protein